jgi:hypothetical protein
MKIKLAELADIIINDMNITRNDIIMVHTSFDKVNLFDSKPEDLIYLLKMIVGTGGTILVPTFSNSTFKFLKFHLQSETDNPVCHTDGIIEQFKQMPDTFSGSSGTASFAVWGRMAKDIAKGLYKNGTSNGDSNIFSLLSSLKAKIIGIGVSLADISLPGSFSETIDAESTGNYPESTKTKPDYSDRENIPGQDTHNLSNLLKTRFPNDQFKLYDKDELNLFKKKGISFFRIDVEKFRSKTMLLSKMV